MKKTTLVAIILTLSIGVAVLILGFRSRQSLAPNIRIVAVGGKPIGSAAVPYGQRKLRIERQVDSLPAETGREEQDIASLRQELDAFYQAGDEVRTIALGELAQEMDRQLKLTEKERLRLERTFRLASKLQLGVDSVADPADQVERQRHLLEQLVMRLRIILGDDARVDMFKERLSGLPRLEYGS
jgi:hypothetical protein